MVGIKANGLVIGCQGFLVPFEVTKYIAFVVVRRRIVGVQADGPVMSCQSFFVLLNRIALLRLFFFGLQCYKKLLDGFAGFFCNIPEGTITICPACDRSSISGE